VLLTRPSHHLNKVSRLADVMRLLCNTDNRCYGGAYDELYKLLQVDIDAWTADGGITNARLQQVRTSAGDYEGFFMHIKNG
jgi:hypothetical protein